MRIDLSFGAKDTIEIPLVAPLRVLLIAAGLLLFTAAIGVVVASTVEEIPLEMWAVIS